MTLVNSIIHAEINLGKGDALLIVPPFALISSPYFGVHLLQSCARRLGYRVSILYANLLFAAYIGRGNYEAICGGAVCEGEDYGFERAEGLGEMLFSSAAYGLSPFESDDPADLNRTEPFTPTISEIEVQERNAVLWADAVANLIAAHDFKVVGCTTTFQQTASSIALLNRVKQLRPDIITIIGGANCESVMARGVLSLSDSIDYVFSGESEVTFPDFLAKVMDGKLPSERIVRERSYIEIEAQPLPDYAEFFHQRSLILQGIERSSGVIYYQSSKGCWWGERCKCAFCALNGEKSVYRYKSSEKVFSDLKELKEKYPDHPVFMVDNVLPPIYFKSLVPRLERELPNADLIYQVRPNLSIKEIAALKRSGFLYLLSGIESFSTSILKLLRKGTTGPGNLAFLRYTRSIGIGVSWNLMIDVPGEQLENLEYLLSLIPLLYHLQPPNWFKTGIQRFSPYFLSPDEFGLSNIRPCDSYFAALPRDADIGDLAFSFEADYKSSSRDHPEVAKRLKKEIDIWRHLWRSGKVPPALTVISKGDGKFILLDTRGLPKTDVISIISRDEARAVLSYVNLKPGDKLLEWALERKLVVEMDSTFVPLATGNPDLILEFEGEIGL